MINQIKKEIERKKIVESLKDLHRNSRKTSNKIYTAAAEAIEFLTIQYEADRILQEIYA